jgi:hypothetical protein
MDVLPAGRAATRGTQGIEIDGTCNLSGFGPLNVKLALGPDRCAFGESIGRDLVGHVGFQ